MKQPMLNISFSQEDMDLFHAINKVSSSRRINRSGLIREILRKHLNEYDETTKDRTKTTISLSAT